ncbi:MAG: Gfo/Idh/MocA family oxidoreductase [Gemmatimonadota bacterium]
MPRVGIVGCGRIGRVHAGNLAGRAELAFCSRTPASAAALQERFGGQVRPSLEQLLASDLDGVVIATPPELHAPQALAALGAGRPVLVEKPLCGSAGELAALEAATAAPGAPLVMVAENYYYKPSLQALRGAVAAGRIGRVRRVEAAKLTYQSAPGWKARWGGLLEGGVHFVALVADLADAALESQTPAAPASVAAQFPGHRPGEPERHVRLDLEYAGGVSASLHYAWDAPALLRGTFQHSRVIGEEGHLTFESNGIYLWERGRGLPRLRLPGLGDLMGYRAMTTDFLACLADPARRPYASLERARRDLEIIFRAYQQLPGPAAGANDGGVR